MAVTVIMKGGAVYTVQAAVEIVVGYWLPNPESSMGSDPVPGYELKDGDGKTVGAVKFDELAGYVIETAEEPALPYQYQE